MVKHKCVVPERYLKARKRIRDKWECATANVYKNEKTEDPRTGITRHSNVCLYENIPLRITEQRSSHTTDTDNQNAATADETIKIILSVEYQIPVGSEFHITQHEKMDVYTNSGNPKIYSDFQEITLKIAEEHPDGKFTYKSGYNGT